MGNWNVKVYDDEGKERETLRGLREPVKDALLQVFRREEITAKAMLYGPEGREMLRSQSVHWRTSHVDSKDAGGER